MSRKGDVVEKRRGLDTDTVGVRIGGVLVLVVVIAVVVIVVGINLGESLEAVRTRASGLLGQDPTWFILWNKDSSIVSTWAQER